MHTWIFGDSTQFVWMPGTDEKAFGKIVKEEHRGFRADDIKIGFMRIENVFSHALGRHVPSTVIAQDGEGEPVVYGKRVLDKMLA
jgi:hypothetical protein